MSNLVRRSALIMQIKALQEELTTVDDLILSDLAGKVKPQGSTTVEYEGRKVTVTNPVTVKWDQDQLRGIADRIRTGGDNPDEFIETKLGVKESSYKAWPESIQKVFIPARTVTPGKPRLEVKE
jgi:hypothetical protein